MFGLANMKKEMFMTRFPHPFTILRLLGLANMKKEKLGQ